MTAAVPLHGVFSTSSILMRIWLFRHHLFWPTIIIFIPGGAIGAFFGVRVFVTLDEAFIATAVGLILLGILWMPSASFRLSAGRPFFAVGIATIAGMAGVLIGKWITHRISEAQFRMVLKGLISLVALRLVFN